MKKKLIFGIAIALIIVLVGGGVYMAFFKKTEAVGTFNLENYNDIIEYYENNFPTEKVPEALGFVDSEKTAKGKLETVWIEIYGKSIKNKKPYNVSFDNENQVWLVQGSLPRNWDGGVPHILIQKSDGKVLAVWHDK